MKYCSSCGGTVSYRVPKDDNRERAICDACGQVHLFDTARLVSDFGAGAETLEAALFSEEDIPWDEIAFHSGKYALKKYFEDRGENNGVHIHELRRSRS